MKYLSTRGHADRKQFCDILLEGLAPDGGLYLPEHYPKVDARAIVTGAHHYASDVQLPGMLHGKVLRPAAIGGRLSSADAQQASAIPGVIVVRDADFIGVAAPSMHEAEKALAAIRAEWTPPASPASDKSLFADLRRSRNSGESNGALEAALSFGADALQRMLQPVGVVDALEIARDLRAELAGRRRMVGVARDLDGHALAVAQLRRDEHRARVGAVVRAGRADDGAVCRIGGHDAF